jgi:4-hydroxybenzoate polyprenyltransferase
MLRWDDLLQCFMERLLVFPDDVDKYIVGAELARDIDIDRKIGVLSIPSRFGVKTALALSALLHLVTVLALGALGRAAGLGLPYAIGVAAIATILAGEHVVVRPGDLSRVDVAFFNFNGWVSMSFLVAVLAELWLG